MFDLDYINIDEDTYKITFGVEFQDKLIDGEGVKVIQILNEILSKGLRANRFEAVDSLSISGRRLTLSLRYLTEKRIKELDKKVGYRKPAHLWFMQYLVAHIDNQFKLSKHPFEALSVPIENYLEAKDMLIPDD